MPPSLNDVSEKNVTPADCSESQSYGLTWLIHVPSSLAAVPAAWAAAPCERSAHITAPGRRAVFSVRSRHLLHGQLLRRGSRNRAPSLDP